MDFDFSDIGLTNKPKKKEKKRSSKSIIMLKPVASNRWEELDFEDCTAEEFIAGITSITGGMVAADSINAKAAASFAGRQRVLHDIIELQRTIKALFRKPQHMM